MNKLTCRLYLASETKRNAFFSLFTKSPDPYDDFSK